MATISERKRKDGSCGYLVQITLSGVGKSSTAKTGPLIAWRLLPPGARRREAELAKPGAVLGVGARAAAVTLGGAIDRYLAELTRAMGLDEDAMSALDQGF